MDLTTILLAFLAALAAAALLALWLGRRQVPPAPLDPAVAKTLQLLQQELGGLKENIARLPSTDVIQGLKERVESVEGRIPRNLTGSVDRLQEGLVKLETEFSHEGDPKCPNGDHSDVELPAAEESEGLPGAVGVRERLEEIA